MDKYSIITMFVSVIVLAFILGALARRIGLPTIVGFLLAGVAVGPYTPAYVGDSNIAEQFAEIGIILLMFGVGLKLSVQDLWSVKGVAIPGALGQMTAATAMGFGLGMALGLSPAESFVLGFSLSVASTVVLLRTLEDRKLLKSENGRICVGWLVIEDLAIVLGIVLLAAIIAALQGAGAAPGVLAVNLGMALAKIALFTALILVVGARLFPWMIVQVAHLKSPELMSLGTLALALALGVAFAANFIFDASFALGAFLAGVTLNATKFTHKVAEDSLPLRDTFAALFFVSVGMLFDPGTPLREPLAVAGVIAIVVIGKSVAALAITSIAGLPLEAGLMVAASLAQIGEFSFVLAGLGKTLGIVSQDTFNLIMAGALVSIAINPFVFRLSEWAAQGRAAAPA
jgi:monovalent cation:H+ antiporter-2, CPA2 family